MDGVKIVYQGGEGEIVEKKSRFIATVCPVNSEEDAVRFIEKIKKKYWDARHNCHAFVVGERNEISRCSDDGEPSGTAGLPMLEVLRKNQLSGVAAVVTRYFGGIKLGAGGLVRAYTGSVSKAVQSCGLARKILMGTFALSADAADAGKLLNIIYQQQLFTVASVEYGQQARILLYMKQEQQDEAERWLTEALNTATQLEQVGSEYVEVPAEREK